MNNVSVFTGIYGDVFTAQLGNYTRAILRYDLCGNIQCQDMLIRVRDEITLSPPAMMCSMCSWEQQELRGFCGHRG
ncbi:MAG: hypothetical protein R2795_08860 [Saprospiraceae bacterium]